MSNLKRIVSLVAQEGVKNVGEKERDGLSEGE